MPIQTRALIKRAAAAVRKTLSAFVTECTARQAVDVLLDQRLFGLNAEEAEAFAQGLDSPPPPTAKLRELMQSRTPWEE